MSITLTVPPLDSETGWTGDFWLQTGVLKKKTERILSLLFPPNRPLARFGLIVAMSMYIFINKPGVAGAVL